MQSEMLILSMIKSLKIQLVEFDLPKAAIRSGSIIENGLRGAVTHPYAHTFPSHRAATHAPHIREAGIDVALASQVPVFVSLA